MLTEGIASGGGGASAKAGQSPRASACSLASSWAAAGETGQIPAETSAQVPTRRLCCQAGSSLLEALPTTLGFTLCSPGGTRGIGGHREGTGLTGSPEAVQAQRPAGSLAPAPLVVTARCWEFCSEKRRFCFSQESQALPGALPRAAEPGPQRVLSWGLHTVSQLQGRCP